MLYAGNTIKVTCEVKTAADVLIDPDEIKLKIYKENYSLLNEYTEVTKEDTGQYSYVLTLPETSGVYILEWYASISSYPYVMRKLIRVLFV